MTYRVKNNSKRSPLRLLGRTLRPGRESSEGGRDPTVMSLSSEDYLSETVQSKIRKGLLVTVSTPRVSQTDPVAARVGAPVPPQDVPLSTAPSELGAVSEAPEVLPEDSNSAPHAGGDLPPKSLHQETMSVLRDKARALGVSPWGRKDDVINRILEASDG